MKQKSDWQIIVEKYGDIEAMLVEINDIAIWGTASQAEGPVRKVRSEVMRALFQAKKKLEATS